MWDIETVQRYLRLLPIKKIFSTKMLTLKLTMLLALTSALRFSEIRHLGIRFYTKSERKFCCSVIQRTRTSKTNKPLPVLEFERFQDENNICVFETLEEYILPRREKSNHTQLLLSYIDLHFSVKTCTLSRWISHALKYADINTEMFTSR